MQIVLDVFGGDNAPNKILDGGLQAVEACGGFEQGIRRVENHNSRR